ncbi:hypothetical protein PG994_000567 [Apiospora phragmitis]|uniref:Uncharacterized protein n=1 Tax=Apiospora phragmitis TaxID=2905665 RepID=A0ABR1X6N8_9PEZI
MTMPGLLEAVPSAPQEFNGKGGSMETSSEKVTSGGEATNCKDAASSSVMVTYYPNEEDALSTPEKRSRDFEKSTLAQLWGNMDKFASTPLDYVPVEANGPDAPKERNNFGGQSLAELKAEADKVMATPSVPSEGIPKSYKGHNEFENMSLSELKKEAKKFLDLGPLIDRILPTPPESDEAIPYTPNARRRDLEKSMEKMTEKELDEFLEKGLYNLLVAKLGPVEADAPSPPNEQEHDPKTATSIPGLDIQKFMTEDQVHDRPWPVDPAGTTTVDTLEDRKTEETIRHYIHTWNLLTALHDRQRWVVRCIVLLPVVKVLSGVWAILLWSIGAEPAPVPSVVRWLVAAPGIAAWGWLLWLMGARPAVAPKHKQPFRPQLSSQVNDAAPEKMKQTIFTPMTLVDLSASEPHPYKIVADEYRKTHGEGSNVLDYFTEKLLQNKPEMIRQRKSEQLRTKKYGKLRQIERLPVGFLSA